MIGESRVLNSAIALKRLANGGHTEMVTREVKTTDGEVIEFEEEVTVTHYAEPGELVDVSQWADVQAYVNQGWIQLLTPDQVEAYGKQQPATTERRGTRSERASTTA